MILATCQHDTTKPVGKDRKGNQRIRCTLCGKYMVEKGPQPLGDMRISMKDATTALGMLLEGMSIRSVERLTGLHRDTIDDLVLTVGDNCKRFFEEKVRNVPAKDVELDELWSFVAMKEKQRITHGESAEIGDSWTFIALESNTRLVLAYQAGQRDSGTCSRFLHKLNRAASGRFQLSSDGLGAYTLAVPFILGGRVDFAQLIKTYAANQTTVRYSPAKISSIEKKPRFGNPDEDKICTSHIERLNLTLRMTMRRFTRLTNGHSKSHKHHVAMQSIFFCFYNFCRKNEALGKQTPAMAAGLTSHTWTIKELLQNAAIAPAN